MNAVLEARKPRARYLAALESPLLQQFDLIATAPKGVARLRALILTLAVQGKLVPQDPNDESAGVLLERIRSEKARLVKEGKIRKDKPLTEITEEEKPFALPPGWEWVRLGQVIELVSGQHLVPSEYSDTLSRDIPYLTGPAEFGALNPKPSRSTDIRRAVAIEGDILVTVKGSGVGKLNVVSDAEIAISRQLMAIRPIVVGHQFLFFALSVLGESFQGKSIGIAIPGIGRDDVRDAAIALPPSAEQIRIVARVEELMALCDALEAKGKLEAEQHARLVGSLFESLANSESAHALAENWQRIVTHFDLLLDRPAAVDALEQSILQLAVRGLLVPQDPADEPANVLLQKIRHKKDCLISAGKIKRNTPRSPLSNEEKPFELPKGWEWVALNDLLPEFQNGVSSRGDVGGKPITVLRLADIKNRRISLHDTREIPINERDAKKYELHKGDILIVRVNGSAEIVGQFILSEEYLTAIYCDHFIRMRIDQNFITPDFLSLLGESDIARSRIQSLFITTAGQKTVNQGHIGSLLLPLPPLPEQSRIVVRVTELRALCTQLRERLAVTAQTQSRLVEALIETAVA